MLCRKTENKPDKPKTLEQYFNPEKTLKIVVGSHHIETGTLPWQSASYSRVTVSDQEEVTCVEWDLSFAKF